MHQQQQPHKRKAHSWECDTEDKKYDGQRKHWNAEKKHKHSCIVGSQHGTGNR